MRVVIDANIFFAALISSGGITQEIIFLDSLDLISPDYINTELKKHTQWIINKTNLPESDLDIAVSLLLQKVKIIPAESYEFKREEASRICLDVNEVAILR